MTSSDRPSLTLPDLYHLLNAKLGNDRFVNSFFDWIVAHAAISHSQIYQDLFVDFILRKTGGRYIEAGAGDGVEFSNTRFLEIQRGWGGTLIEPARSALTQLRSNRPHSNIIAAALSPASGGTAVFCEAPNRHLSSLAVHRNGSDVVGGTLYEVWTVNVDSVIGEIEKVAPLDYVSLDIEGGELSVVKNSRLLSRAAVITVEHNYRDDRCEIRSILECSGYVRVFSEITGWDDWYVKKEILHQARAKV